MKKSLHFDSIKAVIALLILLIGFGVFLLFYTNSESMLEDGRVYPFVILGTICLSLLLGLLYLVNNSKHSHVKVHKAVTSKAVAKKRKKTRK